MFEALDARVQPWARELIAQARTPVPVTSTRRGHSAQLWLYRRHLAGLNRFPVAPPGASKHESGAAWDMVGPPAELRRLGMLWRSWGGVWGGSLDPIHFELGRMRGHPARG